MSLEEDSIYIKIMNNGGSVEQWLEWKKHRKENTLEDYYLYLTDKNIGCFQ